MRSGLIFFVFFSLFPVITFADAKLSSEIQREVEVKYPSAYIIQRKDYSSDVKKYDKDLQNYISGDFDCNGIKDIALQIYHNNTIKLIAIHEIRNGKPKTMDVSQHQDVNIESFRGHYEDPIHLRRQGEEVEFYCDCDDENKEEQELCKKYVAKKSLKGCSMRLNCDAIEWIYDGKAAELFYFDKEDNRYRSVITAD